jgi:hypothetical protein
MVGVKSAHPCNMSMEANNLTGTGRQYRADFSTVCWVALGVALAIVPARTHAETIVRGTVQDVVVEAQNASVRDILVTLTNAFDVQFKSSADLNKHLTGTYKGTLQQAVSRILQGYDLVMKSDQEGLEITLLGTRRSVAAVAAPPAQTVATMGPPTISQPEATGDSRALPIGLAQAAPPVSTSSGAPGTAVSVSNRWKQVLEKSKRAN